MTTPGLLLDGALVDVPGVTVIPPADHGGPAWNYLDPGDYRARPGGQPALILDHTTGGLPNQRVLPGAGPRGHAELIARMWSGRDRSDGQGEGKRIHSGAQVLIDFDGAIYVLCDLVRCAAYHAEMANDVSIGVEHCTTHDGEIYQATLDASAAFHRALCEQLAIPFQVHSAAYRNQPLARCETGRKTANHDGRVQSRCRDIVGILQHRDQTSERGRGDAGDALITAHLAAGARGLDYDGREDLELGRDRQQWLNLEHARRGLTQAPLIVDGVLGPASRAAMRRVGGNWAAVDAAIAAG